MLPTAVEVEQPINEFEIVSDATFTTKTYYMNLEKERVRHYVDGRNAMKQAIFKILQTERYQYNQIYSNNYGVEFLDLIGTSSVYAVPTIQTRITEALTWDERITSVTDFKFDVKKSVIAVEFTAHTIFGDVAISGIEVNI